MKSLERYESENSEFKDKARVLLVEHLGFEPELRVSWKQELNIRVALGRFQDGDLSPKQLTKQVEIFAKLTVVKKQDLESNHA